MFGQARISSQQDIWLHVGIYQLCQSWPQAQVAQLLGEQKKGGGGEPPGAFGALAGTKKDLAPTGVSQIWQSIRDANHTWQQGSSSCFTIIKWLEDFAPAIFSSISSCEAGQIQVKL